MRHTRKIDSSLASISLRIIILFVMLSFTFILSVPISAKEEVEHIKVYTLDQQEINRCVNVVANSFEIIPFYLYETLKTSKAEEYMYWFHIQGKNNCKKDIEISVRFTPILEYPFVETEYKIPDPHRFSKGPGENFDEKINPRYKYELPDLEEGFTVDWVILELPAQKRITGGRSKIQIKSKNKFFWEIPLQNNKKITVSKSFLLASLASWTLSNDKTFIKRAEEIHKKLMKEKPDSINPSEFVIDFITKICNEYFLTSNGIKLIRIIDRLPPKDSFISIDTPAEILKKKQADSLEAALFIGALGKKLKPDVGINLVLINLPNTDSETNSQEIFIAWHNGLANWGGINLDKLRETDFNENLKVSTSKIQKLLDNTPAIISRIQKNGVYYDKDKKLIVLDFPKAIDKYGIKPLP